MKKHLITRSLAFVLALAMTTTMPITMPSVAKADTMQPITLSKLNVIANPTLEFTEVVDYKHDKIVVSNRRGKYVDGNETYGLINLKGDKLLDIKYAYIELLDNGYIMVYAKNNNAYLYNQNMKFLKKFENIWLAQSMDNNYIMVFTRDDDVYLYNKKMKLVKKFENLEDMPRVYGNAFVTEKGNKHYLYMIINGTCKKIDSVDTFGKLREHNIDGSHYDVDIQDIGTGYVYTQKATGIDYCVSYSGIKNPVVISTKMISPGFYIDFNNKTIVNNQGKVIISKYDSIDFHYDQNPDYLIYTVKGKNIAVSKDGNVLVKTAGQLRVYDTFYVIINRKITGEEVTYYTFDHKIIGRFADGDVHEIQIDREHMCAYNPNGDVYIFDSSLKEKRHFKISTDGLYTIGLYYINDIKAFEVEHIYYDSDEADVKPIQYLDLEGNDIFKNNFNITVNKYLGDGYYVFTQNGKKGIGLLPSFPKKEVNRVVKKISVPAATPAKTKIKKIWKKKQASKTLKLSVKQIKKVSGYEVKVYGSKKNAKKSINALATKKINKTTINVKSKKIANKKALYIKVRVYRKDIKGKVYSKWSAIKAVNIVK